MSANPHRETLIRGALFGAAVFAVAALTAFILSLFGSSISLPTFSTLFQVQKPLPVASSDDEDKLQVLADLAKAATSTEPDDDQRTKDLKALGVMRGTSTPTLSEEEKMLMLNQLRKGSQ